MQWGHAVDLVSALEGRHQISFPAHATRFPFFVCDFPSAFSVSGASGSSLRLAKKNGDPMKDQRLRRKAQTGTKEIVRQEKRVSILYLLSYPEKRPTWHAWFSKFFSLTFFGGHRNYSMRQKEETQQCELTSYKGGNRGSQSGRT
jgi:hypothetical protein